MRKLFFILSMLSLMTACAMTEKIRSWSPAESDFLFMSGRSGNGEIYVLPAGQSEWKNLTNHADADNWPVWSADGKRIAFQSKRSGNLDIWVMNADGSEPKQLTNNAEPDYLPSWSPDGQSIVFTSWRKESAEDVRSPHVYQMAADGSHQRRLLAQTLNTSAGASYSPDGNWLVYTRKGEKGADLYVADKNGQNEKRLTHDHDLNIYNGSPEFSPDGKWIAFYSDNEQHAALVIIDSNGNNRRTILAEGKHWYPHWSPDGRWLTYTAPNPANSGDMELYAVAIDGAQAPIPLVSSPQREQEGSWRPK